MLSERKKYILVFVITAGIFLTVFMLTEFLNTKKRQQISNLQNTITVDLLANEAQFDLLKDAPCKAIASDSLLSRKLGELGEKLSFAEQTQGADKKEVVDLKKYYSLLQVKDYLLSQEVAKKCDLEIDSIIYLYGQGCGECTKQGYVLTELKRKYPWLRIYSFDLDMDFAIVETFAGLYDITEKPPVIIIGQEKYSGLRKVDEIESYIPELQKRKELEDKKKGARDFLLENEDLDLTEDDLVFDSVDGDSFVFKYEPSEEDTVSFRVNSSEEGYSLESDSLSKK